MKFSTYFHNVKQEFERMRREAEEEAARKTLGEVKAILQALIEATPYDTGEASRGWRIGANDGLLNGGSPSGATGVTVVTKTGNGQFYITNDVEYIADLNRGHSDQAPAHFIERTILSNPNVRVYGVVVIYNSHL